MTCLDPRDDTLRRNAARIRQNREQIGLSGLVGDLLAVVINVEAESLVPAVLYMLRHTGHRGAESYRSSTATTYVLAHPLSADLIFTTRTAGPNPFIKANIAPRCADRPNTRLETFVFSVSDIDQYVERQREMGTRFLTSRIVEAPDYRFIQTRPSLYTGNSIGVLQWRGNLKSHRPEGAVMKPFDVKPEKPDYCANIAPLDHAATRVRAEDRDPAILEFMTLTNYDFDKAIYVESLNSITNVARLENANFAMVFTSGVSSIIDTDKAGPTEAFVNNFGARTHHLAFRTEEIEDTFARLKESGMEFLVELVGSREEGLKQTFTTPCAETLLVNEYIHRYDGFDGFFTRNNVAELTEATARQ